MLENILAREIKDPFKKEDLNSVEIKVYLELLKDNKNNNDNINKIAEDLFNQLMDNKK